MYKIKKQMLPYNHISLTLIVKNLLNNDLHLK